MRDDLDLSGITDPEARRIIGVLLNAVETLTAENQALRAENQRLRDENNRLKGEQGAPTILPSKRAGGDHASERERRAWRPTQPPTHTDKRSLIRIDRTETREVDPALRISVTFGATAWLAGARTRAPRTRRTACNPPDAIWTLF